MKYSQANARFYTYQCITLGCDATISSNTKLDIDNYCNQCNQRHTDQMIKLQSENIYSKIYERNQIVKMKKRNRNKLKSAIKGGKC